MIPPDANKTPRRGRPSRTNVYERLRIQIGELRESLGGLPSPEEAQDIWRNIWFEEAHHSTAIEGNTLVLRQVEKLLAEGRAVGNKELREYMEVRGYATAADWVYMHGLSTEWSQSGLVTVTELRQIHTLALGPVWDVAPHPQASDEEAPGAFRRHDIEPFPGGTSPPGWPDITAALESWVSDANDLASADTDDVPERLAELHARFERIHPFLDGNGRTGRLVLNLLLIRLGYPPAIIYKESRTRYLNALQRADQGDPGPLGEFLARSVLDNLYRFVVPAIAGPAKLVPLPVLASKELSMDALRVAAMRGRLKAQKAPDGTWRSSQAWVEEYEASRQARGRWTS